MVLSHSVSGHTVEKDSFFSIPLLHQASTACWSHAVLFFLGQRTLRSPLGTVNFPRLKDAIFNPSPVGVEGANSKADSTGIASIT